MHDVLGRLCGSGMGIEGRLANSGLDVNVAESDRRQAGETGARAGHREASDRAAQTWHT